jgi:hypothetical protein
MQRLALLAIRAGCCCGVALVLIIAGFIATVPEAPAFGRGFFVWSGRPVVTSRGEQLYEKAEEEGQRCRD